MTHLWALWIIPENPLPPREQRQQWPVQRALVCWDPKERYEFPKFSLAPLLKWGHTDRTFPVLTLFTICASPQGVVCCGHLTPRKHEFPKFTLAMSSERRPLLKIKHCEGLFTPRLAALANALEAKQQASVWKGLNRQDLSRTYPFHNLCQSTGRCRRTCSSGFPSRHRACHSARHSDRGPKHTGQLQASKSKDIRHGDLGPIHTASVCKGNLLLWMEVSRGGPGVWPSLPLVFFF